MDEENKDQVTEATEKVEEVVETPETEKVEETQGTPQKSKSMLPIVGVIVLVAIALGAGGFYLFTKNKGATLSSQTEATAEPKAEATASAAPSAIYTLGDVAKHSKAGDCWLAIDGKVYDVSSFAKHPGGEAILQGCGKDATTLFETRPMGSGTPHSERARTTLANFLIGTLK